MSNRFGCCKMIPFQDTFKTLFFDTFPPKMVPFMTPRVSHSSVIVCHPSMLGVWQLRTYRMAIIT